MDWEMKEGWNLRKWRRHWRQSRKAFGVAEKIRNLRGVAIGRRR